MYLFEKLTAMSNISRSTIEKRIDIIILCALMHNTLLVVTVSSLAQCCIGELVRENTPLFFQLYMSIPDWGACFSLD